MSLKINGTTSIYCIIGDPIGHSLSPVMQNAAFIASGINSVYVSFRVKSENISESIKGLVSLGIKGFNITVPHKTRIMDYLGTISETARIVGAVNTVVINDNVLEGHNTDVQGFIDSIKEVTGEIRFPESVCIIGAGGAARSVVYALGKLSEVSEIHIMNRTLSKADSLAAELESITGKKITPTDNSLDSQKKIIPSSGMVVNTTSIGMWPSIDESPVKDNELFRKGQIVCDIVYNPVITRFLNDARKAGALTIDGTGMLLHQGAKAFEIWTGKKAPVDIMRNAVIEGLSQ